MSDTLNLITDEQGRNIYEITGLQEVVSNVFGVNWPKTPVVNVGVQVNIKPADDYRKAYTERHGVHVTLMTMIQSATAVASRSYPLISGLFEDDSMKRVIVPDPDDIGVSGPVMVEDTVIPILIERASSKSIGDIAEEMTQKVELINDATLLASDSRAVFEKRSRIPNIGISNIGMMGPVNFFTTIPIAPSLSALFVPAAIPSPFVDKSKNIVVAPAINFCLAFNHKALAAGPVAAYLGRLKNLLEEPEQLT